MNPALAMLALAALILAGAAYATAPRLADTASGTIDRTNKTDRLKAPRPDVRVVAQCRSA